jgi:uncharacterized membrane protein
MVVVSILNLIMGIIIIILGVYLHRAELFKNSSDEVAQVGNAAFYVMVIVGATVAAYSIVGFITAKCANCCCSIFYAVLALIIWVILAVIGIVMVALGSLTEE